MLIPRQKKGAQLNTQEPIQSDTQQGALPNRIVISRPTCMQHKIGLHHWVLMNATPPPPDSFSHVGETDRHVMVGAWKREHN